MTLWVTNFDEAYLKPSPQLWQWMQTTTSITEKAKHACNKVELKLLKEGWVSESNQPSVFIREINMLCDGKIAWYARTKIPQETYKRREKQFKALHEQPLGSILFHDSHIVRQPLVYAYLIPSKEEYQWAIKHYNAKEKKPNFLWARKSVFLIDGEPLYLIEIFFPEAFDGKYI